MYVHVCLSVRESFLMITLSLLSFVAVIPQLLSFFRYIFDLYDHFSAYKLQ